jgi:hypothetical protein
MAVHSARLQLAGMNRSIFTLRHNLKRAKRPNCAWAWRRREDDHLHQPACLQFDQLSYVRKCSVNAGDKADHRGAVDVNSAKCTAPPFAFSRANNAVRVASYHPNRSAYRGACVVLGLGAVAPVLPDQFGPPSIFQFSGHSRDRRIKVYLHP